METIKLTQELSEKPQAEIELSLLLLLMKGKIDFVNLSNSYVEYLNLKSQDKEKIISELGTCLLSLMTNFVSGKKTLSDYKNKVVQRSLYNLNRFKNINDIESINEEYYDRIMKFSGQIGDINNQHMGEWRNW